MIGPLGLVSMRHTAPGPVALARGIAVPLGLYQSVSPLRATVSQHVAQIVRGFCFAMHRLRRPIERTLLTVPAETKRRFPRDDCSQKPVTRISKKLHPFVAFGSIQSSNLISLRRTFCPINARHFGQGEHESVGSIAAPAFGLNGEIKLLRQSQSRQ